MARMVIRGPCNYNKRKILKQLGDDKGCVGDHPHTDLALLQWPNRGMD
jgi:hypothetical protein